jgi:outer membrane lipoprotein LolB
MSAAKQAARLAFLLVLGACAQLQTATEPAEFSLSGRLAARSGDEAFSGSVQWRHSAASDEVLITTPLGQGVARIVREGDAVVLTTAEPKEYRAADVESLTEKALGFRLPLAGLADWVRGRPSGRVPFELRRGEDGRIRSLEQNGWKIEFTRYEGELPTRLQLHYPGVELRLAITEWK